MSRKRESKSLTRESTRQKQRRTGDGEGSQERFPVHKQPTFLQSLAKGSLRPSYTSLQNKPVQQDDDAKTFFLDIGSNGLLYAWAKYYKDHPNPDNYAREKTDNPKNIIIVGAGFAGLSAAYELEQVGHKTTILEVQHRVGGRAKTIFDGLSEGVHAEGGAMRLPLNEHFLTDHYINIFNVPIRDFQNTNDKAWLNLYGENIRMEEWKTNNLDHLDDYFCEAADFIRKLRLKSIDELYEKTLEPVKKEIERNPTPEGWDKWVEKWSKYSLESFLRNGDIDNEDGLRPWPEDAIQAYKVTTYSPTSDRSLVEILRDDLGKWWSDNLWTPKAGMQSFAEQFIKRGLGWNQDVFLSEKISYGRRVDEIEIKDDEVIVRGRNTTTGDGFDVSGDAAVITLPLPVIRQLSIKDKTTQKNIWEIQKVISDIHYEPSTKVLLQCKTRFWEDTIGNGGFSKTNLPIGQIHYPSAGNRVADTDRAVLVCYTWGQDAIIMGAQPEDESVASAVRQLESIHPNIREEFEVGRVQAWTRDPAAQIAFTNLNPNQYNYAMKKLLNADVHPLHIAGEAISWSHGWIQGALESGLHAAYNIVCKYEK